VYSCSLCFRSKAHVGLIARFDSASTSLCSSLLALARRFSISSFSPTSASRFASSSSSSFLCSSISNSLAQIFLLGYRASMLEVAILVHDPRKFAALRERPKNRAKPGEGGWIGWPTALSVSNEYPQRSAAQRSAAVGKCLNADSVIDYATSLRAPCSSGTTVSGSRISSWLIKRCR